MIKWKALPPSSRAAREVERNTALRQARTCYDHIAGVAGVTLLDIILDNGWVQPEIEEDGGRRRYRLTSKGDAEFCRRTVDIASARRSNRCFAFGCMDWTERRDHLAGALGAAVLNALISNGIIRRHPHTRKVTMLRPLDYWFSL